MAWNEPGGGRDNDPWSNPRRSGKPPNIDDAIDKLQKKFGGAMGGGGGKGIAVVILLVLAGWLASGFYIVDEGQRGVVLRFGEYTSTSMPGPHWHLPYPFSTVETVNVDEYRDKQVNMSVLTSDENIVEVKLASQFNVSDPVEYLFNVRNPDQTLADVMQSAIREVIGNKKMDYVLTDGRVKIVDDVRERMQELLNGYKTGLKVKSVNLQDVQPPEAVQPAFEDAIRAREDKQRYISEAQAYANQVVPRAKGDAAQVVEKARGYKARVVDAAKGETSRFQDLLKSYRLAPEITRERIYIDTIGGILSKNHKVVVDPSESKNILYLPLDKLGSGSAKSGSDQDASGSSTVTTMPAPTASSSSSGNGSSSSNSLTSDSRSGLRTRGSE